MTCNNDELITKILSRANTIRKHEVLSWLQRSPEQQQRQTEEGEFSLH